MSVILMEGFDHFTNGGGFNTELQYERKYKGTASSSISAHSSTTPNSEGYSLSLGSNGYSFCPYFGDYYANSASSYSIPQGVVGFHFYTSNIDSDDTSPIVQLCYTDTLSQLQVRVEGSNGRMQLYRGDGTFLADSSSLSISNSTWYYIELKYQISNSISANSTILNVNGTPWITLPSSTDTQAQGTNSTRCVKWLGSQAGRLIDNVYLSDGTSFFNQGGGVFVKTIYPSSNSSVNFSPSAGSNYQCVDEAGPNEDSDYNQSSTAGHKDLFNFEDLSSDPDIDSVIAVGSVIYARRTTPRMSSIQHACGAYSAYYKYNALNQNYDYYQYIWQSNPAGGSWTKANVSSSTFGYTFSSSADSDGEYV